MEAIDSLINFIANFFTKDNTRQSKEIVEMRSKLIKISNDDMELTPAQKKEGVNEIEKKLLEKHRDKLEKEYEFIKEEEKEFLHASLKDWDREDIAAVLIAVGVGITLERLSYDEVDGKKKHKLYNADNLEGKYAKKHTSKSGNDLLKVDVHKRNGRHKNMPMDILPKKYGGHFEGRFLQGAKFKDKYISHRYLFGHDILKPWEIFKDLNKIDPKSVGPIIVKKVVEKGEQFQDPKGALLFLGRIQKCLLHLFYDTFSHEGIPSPGTTWFNKYFLDNSQFTRYCTIHYTDIKSSGGVDGVLEIYTRYRQLKENGKIKDVFNPAELLGMKLKNRKFRDYEIAMTAHAILIWIQFNSKLYGGRINNRSVQRFTFNLFQYSRLNINWNKAYKKLVYTKIREVENPLLDESIEESYKEISIIYGIEYTEDYETLLKRIEEKSEDKRRELEEVRVLFEKENKSENDIITIKHYIDLNRRYLINELGEENIEILYRSML